jgi:tripartite-type tricarboxylate transporter receptor subunit TctC
MVTMSEGIHEGENTYIGHVMGTRRNFLIAATAAFIVLTTASTRDAMAQQDWPSKPVKIIVPFQPGGTADILGRLIAQHLTEVFKQAFVVENRGGAGGVIGSQVVARAEPDGHTLLVSGVGSHVVAPATMAKSYDAMKEFTHIAMLGGPSSVLVVNPAVPARNLKEFISYARSRPEGISWGSPGQGTHSHLIKPDVRERFANEGIETSSMDAAAFTRFFKSEIEFWAPYVKAPGAEK